MSKKRQIWGFALAALLTSLALATLVSPFASPAPDGLDKVAEDKGFSEKSEGTLFWRFSLFSDYEFSGVANKRISTAIAGIVGTLLVFGAGLGVAKLLADKNRKSPPSQGA